MLNAERIPTFERRYSLAELFELRRGTLLYARSFPVGAVRNQHRQIALSLRTLFKNKRWLAAHTVAHAVNDSDQAGGLAQRLPRLDASA